MLINLVLFVEGLVGTLLLKYRLNFIINADSLNYLSKLPVVNATLGGVGVPMGTPKPDYSLPVNGEPEIRPPGLEATANARAALKRKREADKLDIEQATKKLN